VVALVPREWLVRGSILPPQGDAYPWTREGSHGSRVTLGDPASGAGHAWCWKGGRLEGEVQRGSRGGPPCAALGEVAREDAVPVQVVPAEVGGAQRVRRKVHGRRPWLRCAW
jgi:hypothetical protein